MTLVLSATQAETTEEDTGRDHGDEQKRNPPVHPSNQKALDIFKLIFATVVSNGRVHHDPVDETHLIAALVTHLHFRIVRVLEQVATVANLEAKKTKGKPIN